MSTRRRFAGIIAAVLFCLPAFTAYGQTKEETTDSLLVQRGLRLTENMRKLADIPRYLELALGDSTGIRITRELAVQASGSPHKAFAIGNLKAAIQSIPLMPAFLEEAIPEDVRGEVTRRIFGVLPTLINKEVDVKIAALFSVLSTENVFRCEGLTDPVFHFYRYNGTCHSMVLFLPYKDGLVKATALLVMNPELDGVRTADDVQNVFEKVLLMEGVRVREIKGSIVQNSN